VNKKTIYYKNIDLTAQFISEQGKIISKQENRLFDLKTTTNSVR